MTPEEILHLVTEIICALTRGAVAVADIISAYKQKRRRRREARAAASTLKDGQLRSQMMMSHPHQNLLQPQRVMTRMIMMMDGEAEDEDLVDHRSSCRNHAYHCTSYHYSAVGLEYVWCSGHTPARYS